MPGPGRAGESVEERAFHSWLVARLPAGRAGLLPLGDDAAALAPPRSAVAVLSTDALVEGTHFLRRSRPDRVGAAATAVTLSDLAAKGARPVGILIALAVPVGTPARWVEKVVEGAERMAARHGAHVVGGDTKPGPVRTVVSFGLGWGRARHLAPRSDAGPGDLLVQTGVVGRGGVAAAALGSARGTRRKALAAMLDVRPRVREGAVLAPIAHAMLDTSDGLAESARLLADASRARVVIEEGRLPLDPRVSRLASSLAGRRRLAFYGGDYELLAAIPPGLLDRATRAVRSVRGGLTVVGRVERGRGAWLAHGKTVEPMPPPGWRPFEPGRRRPR